MFNFRDTLRLLHTLPLAATNIIYIPAKKFTYVHQDLCVPLSSCALELISARWYLLIVKRIHRKMRMVNKTSFFSKIVYCEIFYMGH